MNGWSSIICFVIWKTQTTINHIKTLLKKQINTEIWKKKPKNSELIRSPILIRLPLLLRCWIFLWMFFERKLKCANTYPLVFVYFYGLKGRRISSELYQCIHRAVFVLCTQIWFIFKFMIMTVAFRLQQACCVLCFMSVLYEGRWLFAQKGDFRQACLLCGPIVGMNVRKKKLLKSKHDTHHKINYLYKGLKSKNKFRCTSFLIVRMTCFYEFEKCRKWLGISNFKKTFSALNKTCLSENCDIHFILCWFVVTNTIQFHACVVVNENHCSGFEIIKICVWVVSLKLLIGRKFNRFCKFYVVTVEKHFQPELNLSDFVIKLKEISTNETITQSLQCNKWSREYLILKVIFRAPHTQIRAINDTNIVIFVYL